MDLGLVYMYGKLKKIGLKLSWRVQDSKGPFSSSNCSNHREIGICPATQTLFSVQLISQVLEVQMYQFVFCLESWDNFPELSWRLSAQILMLAMMFSADKKIKIVTKSRDGHPLNN
jgi:hypothetical protein